MDQKTDHCRENRIMISSNGNLREFASGVKRFNRQDVIAIAESETEAAERMQLYSYIDSLSALIFLLGKNEVDPHYKDVFWKEFLPLFREMVKQGEIFPEEIMKLVNNN